MRFRATDKAMARVSGEVIERVKARSGAFYREVIGARALARAGMLDLVEGQHVRGRAKRVRGDAGRGARGAGRGAERLLVLLVQEERR